MASTKEYLDFVLEQLSGIDEVSYRAMMGEYILYYRGRVFGGIYDDRLLVKPVPAAVKLMPDASMELPYEGAKENGISFRAIHIESRYEAQNAPTPITNYALFHDGEYVTNEQMNDKKFLKLVKR